jgi:hypothetical protein
MPVGEGIARFEPGCVTGFFLWGEHLYDPSGALLLHESAESFDGCFLPLHIRMQIDGLGPQVAMPHEAHHLRDARSRLMECGSEVMREPGEGGAAACSGRLRLSRSDRGTREQFAPTRRR